MNEVDVIREVEQAKQDGKVADLTELALPSARFEHANLAGANLSGAQLNVSQFTDCDLRGCNLTGTDLRAAKLTRVDLRGANLASASLSGAILSECLLDGCDLHEANLAGLRGPACSLVDSDLRKANLTGAQLKGAHLVECDLSGASLPNADLGGGDLSDANFEDADLSNASLQNANLSRASLLRSRCLGTRFSGANVKNTNFRQARLIRGELAGLLLEGAALQGADLWGADLSGANLRGADLTFANLVEAKVYRTDFTGADLRGARLEHLKTEHGAPVFVGALYDDRTVMDSGSSSNLVGHGTQAPRLPRSTDLPATSAYPQPASPGCLGSLAGAFGSPSAHFLRRASRLDFVSDDEIDMGRRAFDLLHEASDALRHNRRIDRATRSSLSQQAHQLPRNVEALLRTLSRIRRAKTVVTPASEVEIERLEQKLLGEVSHSLLVLEEVLMSTITLEIVSGDRTAERLLKDLTESNLRMRDLSAAYADQKREAGRA